MLLLYSKLLRGEKINKLAFCLEADILPRTFDRDIEDIRLYLSELFYAEELLYDRRDKVYYLSGTRCQPLEDMEYMFVERVLLDTGVLRRDEMDGILSHLAHNTKNAERILMHQKESLESYYQPINHAPILKMHGDLQTIINHRSVIEIRYIKMDGVIVNRILIPCMVRYDLGYLYLIAYQHDKMDQCAAYYRLDRIYSFSVVRKQTQEETSRVKVYVEKYSSGIIQMYGGEFIEVILGCKNNYYPYVYDKFQMIETIEERTDTWILKTKVFEDGFVKWMLSQPPDQIWVLEPVTVRNKICATANELVKKYAEV